jgi:HlyD family secretion protein
MKRAVLIVVVIVVLVAAVLGWRYTHRSREQTELALHGNVDLRQVELPFNNSERIVAVLVQEGDRVQRGQVLARLDTSRLEPQVAQAEAQAAAQKQVVARLQNGSRPEEIAQAKAQVDSAQADAANARRQFDRVQTLSQRSAGEAVSQQDLDNAKATLDMADAKLAVGQKALDLAMAGPRKEEVFEAEARLRASEAQLVFLRRQLTDTQLIAPVDAVVRTRIMEPGEMASPQKAVFSLAVIDPKWVRAYATEADLGKVHPGMAASIAVDSAPGKRFDGWVGFVSPVAEFTPKTVQTEDLRTSLVYELRVFVKDPGDDLRLGQPATVYLPLDQRGSAPSSMPATSPSTVPVGEDGR